MLYVIMVNIFISGTLSLVNDVCICSYVCMHSNVNIINDKLFYKKSQDTNLEAMLQVLDKLCCHTICISFFDIDEGFSQSVDN